MFRERLITTLILIPLVLLGIYFANYWLFAAVFALATLACAYEWLQLIPLDQKLPQLFFVALIWLLMAATHLFYPLWGSLGALAWLFITAAIWTFPASKRWWGKRAIIVVLACIVLPLFFQSLLKITSFQSGKALLLYLLLLVWAADIGAYLAGKQWGKNKLIPAVSPGKTVEGFSGGLGLSLVVSVVAYFYFKPGQSVVWFFLAVAIGVIALIGDLFISMLKRRTGVKDTGHILPGHGGILDRLDSLIAAAPLFYAALSYFYPGL